MKYSFIKTNTLINSSLQIESSQIHQLLSHPTKPPYQILINYTVYTSIYAYFINYLPTNHAVPCIWYKILNSIKYRRAVHSPKINHLIPEILTKSRNQNRPNPTWNMFISNWFTHSFHTHLHPWHTQTPTHSFCSCHYKTLIKDNTIPMLTQCHIIDLATTWEGYHHPFALLLLVGK